MLQQSDDAMSHPILGQMRKSQGMRNWYELDQRAGHKHMINHGL